MPALPSCQKATMPHRRTISPPLPNAPLPRRQDARQRGVQRLVGAHEEIVDSLAAAGFFERLTKGGQLALIGAAYDLRIGLHLGKILQALDLDRPAKRKVELGRVQHV